MNPRGRRNCIVISISPGWDGLVSGVIGYMEPCILEASGIWCWCKRDAKIDSSAQVVIRG